MENMKPTSFLLEEELKAQLRVEAARRNMTMSEFLREIIAEKLKAAPFFADSAQRDTQNAQPVAAN